MADEMLIKAGLIKGTDDKTRCFWHKNLPDYLHYHDHEWGRPILNDHHLFERVCLEGFQSGLSWLTILRKRENLRTAFEDFDFERVSRFSKKNIEQLLIDSKIIRHRGKIQSTINNAKQAIKLASEKGSLAAYFWSFEPSINERPEIIDYPTLIANPKTLVSIRISKDLKKRGWSFVGPKTIYAFMQAVGLVNDHIEGCFYRAEVEIERKAFQRPK